MNEMITATTWNIQTAAQLGWILTQASVIAAAAYLLVVLARRITPGARVRISLLGLLLMAVVPIVGVSFTTGWSWGQLFPRESGQTAGGQIADGAAIKTAIAGGMAVSATRQPEALTPWQRLLVSTSAIFVASELPGEQGTFRGTADRELPSREGLWPIVTLAIAGLLVAYGIIRLLAGYWQINRLRSAARTIDDNKLIADIDDCMHQLGLSRRVTVAETRVLGSAAIVGWRKPLLLLPMGWREWNAQERQAVLSHELAHVKRSDFLSTAVGQLAVAVNFYHPLAHIVLQRLRLDQELAADTLAAQVVGGQQRYIEILAGLALRQPKVRTPGPCQAFLPPRRMFVRRLEMLRNLPTSALWINRCYSAIAVLSLVAVAVLATGLRPLTLIAQEISVPASGENALAATPATDSDRKALIEYLPSGLCEAVAVVDVQSVLQCRGVEAIVEQMELPEEFDIQGVKMSRSDLDQIAVAFLTAQQGDGASDPLLVFRSNQSFAGSELRPQLRLLDAHTLAFHSRAEVLQLLAIGGGDKQLKKLLGQNEAAHIRLASKTDLLSKLAAPSGRGGPMMAFSPLWEDVQTIAAGLTLTDDVVFESQLNTSEPKRVADTLTALKWLASNYLKGIPKAVQEESGNNPTQMVMASAGAEAGSKFLDSLKINSDDSQVELTARLPDAVYPMIGLAVPAIASAQTAARRSQSMNNIKQLLLALHNYESVYGNFPSAVVVDPDTGVKRSWRVELLPFLEQADLYEQYRQDEPWDSNANKRVLMQMPLVFAIAGANGTQSTPYQAIVSEGGGLTPRKDGNPPRIRDIVDGTSNTVVIVETKRVVPWTQPIDLSDTARLPSLGTARSSDPGIVVGLADGSVRFVSDNIDPTVWKALTTRDGGEVANLD